MSIHVVIQDGPIDPPPAPNANAGPGASLQFLGIVRPLENGRPIEALHYEIYEPMAGKVLEELCRQARARFDVLAVCLIHSRGHVPVGRASLLVTIESAHRAAALDAMAWLIDALKNDAPIWKHPVTSQK